MHYEFRRSTVQFQSHSTEYENVVVLVFFSKRENIFFPYWNFTLKNLRSAKSWNEDSPASTTNPILLTVHTRPIPVALK